MVMSFARRLIVSACLALSLLTNHASLAQIISTSFSQLSYYLDDGNVDIPDSDWGVLRLESTVSSSVVYLNLNVNDEWVIENEPVLSDGVDFSFGLGNEVGTPVGDINYGIELTSDIIGSMPPLTSTASVSSQEIAFNSGFPGMQLPHPGGGERSVGGKAASPVPCVNKGIGNPEQEYLDCAPAAFRNSLKWLKTKHNLGIPEDKLTLAHVKVAMDYDAMWAAPTFQKTSKAGGPPKWFWQHKMDEYNKWVVTEIIQPGGDVDRIAKLLKHDCDIEMFSTGHMTVVVGWTKMKNGEYKIDVQDDAKQGEVGGNEKPYRVTWDKANNKLTQLGEVNYFICECPRKRGGIKGDPHVMTWSGQLFDFQGECDLVFVHAPDFGQGRGLGMDKSLDLHLHARTKIRYDYSYIEAAALGLGDDTLEVAGWGHYIVNGVARADLGENGCRLAGLFPIYHTQVNEKHHIFEVVIDPSMNITFSTFKDIVSVEIKGGTIDDFEDSVGLLGSFENGVMLARDGQTIIANATAFGQEWQVQKEEPMLFQTIRAPQHPQEKCRLPSSDAIQTLRRRLGESSLLEREAEEACAHLTGDRKDACVMDVVAFGDTEFAQAVAY